MEIGVVDFIPMSTDNDENGNEFLNISLEFILSDLSRNLFKFLIIYGNSIFINVCLTS